MQNYRPDNWVEISNNAVTRLKKLGIDFNPACFIAGAVAMRIGIALKLQAIYNLPDEGMFH